MVAQDAQEFARWMDLVNELQRLAPLKLRLATTGFTASSISDANSADSAFFTPPPTVLTTVKEQKAPTLRFLFQKLNPKMVQSMDQKVLFMLRMLLYPHASGLYRAGPCIAVNS